MRSNDSIGEHEATVSKISEEQLFYLMSRGLTQKEAMEMIVMGSLSRLLANYQWNMLLD